MKTCPIILALSLMTPACGSDRSPAERDAGADIGETDAASADRGRDDAEAGDSRADSATGDASDGGDDEDGGDAGDGGTDAAADAESGDALSSDVPFDGGTSDAESLDGSSEDGSVNTFGFTIRAPSTRTIPCQTLACPSPTIEVEDVDYLCTLRWDSYDHYIYVQAHAVEWLDFSGILFEADGAWISDGVLVDPISATYDFGGNHHNESIRVEAEQHVFQYWHSTFGFGYRACLPPDCLRVFTASGDEIEDGCTSARTLPEVCVRVRSDGSLPPLVDNYARCPGDGG